MAKRLYVGNLAYETTNEELQQLFAGVGAVESVNVITDRATGRSKGFGFVEMSNDEEAAKAITEINNKELGGRNIRVSEARPQNNAPGA